MDCKQVIILDSGTFTRSGIEALLTRISTPNCVVASLASKEAFLQVLPDWPRLDMLVMSLQGRDFRVIDALSLITDTVRMHAPGCRVVVVTDMLLHSLLTEQLHHQSNVHAVADSAASTLELAAILQDALAG